MPQVNLLVGACSEESQSTSGRSVISEKPIKNRDALSSFFCVEKAPKCLKLTKVFSESRTMSRTLRNGMYSEDEPISLSVQKY